MLDGKMLRGLTGTPMRRIERAKSSLAEADLRKRLNAPAEDATQALYVSDSVKTGRIMAKDEDVCLHCGLCAERCPTGAWDMRKYYMEMTQAEHACRKQ